MLLIKNYTHFHNIESAMITDALYFSGHEGSSTMFNNEAYQQFVYDTCCITMASFVGGMEMQVILNNGNKLSIMTKLFYDIYVMLQIVSKFQQLT